MPQFKSLDALLKYAQAEVNEALQEDVAPVVEAKLQEKIQEDVYDAYTPVKDGYTRRNELKNEKNIVSELVDDGKLFTKDIASPDDSVMGTAYQGTDPTMFARWVNDGLVPNIFNYEHYPWEDPALFIEDTVKDLEDSGDAVKALKSGLAKKGIKTTTSIGR